MIPKTLKYEFKLSCIKKKIKKKLVGQKSTEVINHQSLLANLISLNGLDNSTIYHALNNSSQLSNC